MKPYILVSHASQDKNTPPFRRVLEALVAAGISLGIDRPNLIVEPCIPPELLAWSLEPTGEDFVEAIKGAIARGACGMILLASAHTPASSWVWREFLGAKIAQELRGDALFKLFCLDIDDDAKDVRPDDVKSVSFYRIGEELEALVDAIRKHVEAVAEHQRALPADSRALIVAMQDLTRKNEFITVVGRRSFGGGYFRLHLDHIYTALRGDVLSADERTAAHRQHAEFEREVRGELIANSWSLLSPGDLDRETRLSALKARSVMPGMPLGAAAREQPGTRAGSRQTLAGAVSSNPTLVILGEPASGKSTLLRWLGLRFAEAWLTHEGRPGTEVTALARHVDPDERGDATVSIGPLKVPVTIPMSEVAAFVARGGSDVLDLIAQRWHDIWDRERFAVPTPHFGVMLVNDLAREGRLIVLLDGLDEVNDLEERWRAIEAVVDFAERWTRPLQKGPRDPSTDNRLIVTSRIVGYQELRLPESWPHVVVDRMTPDAVKTFWTHLFREFDSPGVGTPEAAAAELHGKVFGGTHGGLEDLAGIPLLATLLAVVFERRAAHFPRHRIEIYDSAIQHLVVEWREHAKANITAARWKRWLCPIAKYMHESGSQALISNFELDQQLGDRLEELDPGITSRFERERLTQEFRSANDRYIGLLVERADGLYAFVHRSFQEYLAAFWLMDDPDSAVERILRRWEDPRWREAVLLAFGHERLRGDLRRETRDTFFHALLDRSEERTRPRLARLLATAVMEMPNVPSEAVIARLVKEMLADFGGESLYAKSESERTRLEEAIYALADSAPDAFEAAFSSVIRDGRPEIACAAAELAVIERWRFPVMVDALRAALSKDVEGRGFPIGAALRQALTEIAQQAEHPRPDEPRPEPPGVMDETSDAGDRTEHRRKMLRWMIHRSSYVRRIRKWRVDSRLAASITVPPSAEASSFADAANRDFRWRAITAALFGAFGDRDAARGVDEYNRLSAFLQDEDMAREQTISDDDSLIGRFGYKDPVYGTAVYIDTHGKALRRDATIPPRFDLDLALPIAEIPDVLASAAASLADSRPAALLELADTADTVEMRAMILFAACLANVDNSFSVFAAVGDLGDAERTALETIVVRARHAISDAAYRACSILNTLTSFPVTLPAAQRVALPIALESVARLKPSSPVAVSKAVASVSDRMRAERIAQNLSLLPSDDFAYNAALALDDLGALGLFQLSVALQYIPETASTLWARAVTGTSWGDVWPRSERRADITPSAFDLALTSDAGGDIHPGLRTGLAVTILGRLTKEGDPATQVAMAPYFWLVGSDQESASFPPGAQRALMTAVENLDDPYLKARGLLALAERGAVDAVSLVNRAGDVAEEIELPVERFIVFERLANFRGGDAWEAAFHSATTAALAIADPAQRWRACVRLAERDREHHRLLLRTAVTALDAIPDAFLRAEEWTAAKRFIKPEAFAAAEWSPTRESSFQAPILLELSDLRGDFDADFALALYVAQACLDVTDAIVAARARVEQRSRPNQNVAVVRSLLPAAAAGDPRSVGDLERTFAAGPPELTSEIAAATIAIARHDPDAAERLAKSVRIGSGASLRAAEAWLEDETSPLAFEAAAVMARRLRRRDEAVLRPLLAAVIGDDDRRAARACQALTRGSLFWQRPPRILRSDDVGLAGLLEVARFMHREVSRPVRVVGACFLADVEHRDASLIAQICELGNTGGLDAAAARSVLSMMGSATHDVLRTLCAAIEPATPEVQLAIVDGLASIAQEEAAPKEQLAAWLPKAAHALKEPIRMLYDGGEDLVRALDRALSEANTEPQQLQRAKAYLDEYRIDLRERLVQPDAVIAALEARVSALSVSQRDLSPFKHARKDLYALKGRHGRAVVTIVGTWLGELLVEAEADKETLRYVAFAALELGIDNPALLTQALVRSIGDQAGLRTHLAALAASSKEVSAAASAITLGCMVGPLDGQMIQTMLAVAKRPIPNTFTRIERSLEVVNGVTDDALPFLEAALDGDSARVTYIAIRILGILVRDSLLSPAIRRRGRIALDGVVSSPLGWRELIMFVETNKKGAGRSLRSRGTLREAALRELSWID